MSLRPELPGLTARTGRPRGSRRSLANILIYKDRYASIHLARLLLAGEDRAYRQFAQALAERLQRWPKSVMQVGDVILVMRAAARDVVGETRSDGQ